MATLEISLDRVLARDAGLGHTSDSLKTWRETRSQFGYFVQAYVYRNDLAALQDMVPSFGIEHDVYPTLILMDASGQQLWLTGCTGWAGETARRGTAEILAAEGFGTYTEILAALEPVERHDKRVFVNF